MAATKPEPKKILIDNVAVPEKDTKTAINFSAPTPKWATYMFLIVLLLCTVTTAYLAATDLLTEHTKYEVTVFLNVVVVPFVWGISKIFGIELKDK